MTIFTPLPEAEIPSRVIDQGNGGALDRARRRTYLPMLLPALILYLLLYVAPAAAGMIVSLSTWSGLGAKFTWVGIQNYVDLFTDRVFLSAFGNTLALTLIVGVAIFVIVSTSMIVLRSTKGRAFIRSAVFLPSIISPIAIGVAVAFLFNPNGLVNGALGMFKLDALQRPWLGPDYILSVIVVGVIWSSAGFYVVLLMSAVDSIPESLFEAARIEGASLFQQFRHITLPLTRDMFSTAAVLWVIAGIKTFEIILAVTGKAGTPPIQARTLAIEQYLLVTTGADGGIPQLGSATAIGVVMTAITVILILLSRRIARRDSLEL